MTECVVVISCINRLTKPHSPFVQREITNSVSAVFIELIFYAAKVSECVRITMTTTATITKMNFFVIHMHAHSQRVCSLCACSVYVSLWQYQNNTSACCRRRRRRPCHSGINAYAYIYIYIGIYSITCALYTRYVHNAVSMKTKILSKTATNHNNHTTKWIKHIFHRF